MTIYTMTPINSGTRLRPDHNVFGVAITSYNPPALIGGNELWEAQLDGSEVKKGDKWLKVTHVNGLPVAKSGWMALVHKGVAICKDFKEVVDAPPPPVISSIAPMRLEVKDPSPVGGWTAEYVFNKYLPNE